MNRIFFLVLVGAAAPGFAQVCTVSPLQQPVASVLSCGFLADKRIVNSVPVVRAGKLTCNGVLLAEDMVLTSGHCTTPQPYAVTAYAPFSSVGSIDIGVAGVQPFAGLDLALVQLVKGGTEIAGQMGTVPEFLAPGDDVDVGSTVLLLSNGGNAILTTVTASTETTLEYDAESYSSWSGSPVIDSRGRVVAIHKGQASGGALSSRKQAIRLRPILQNTGSGKLANQPTLARRSQAEFAWQVPVSAEQPILDRDDQQFINFAVDFPVSATEQTTQQVTVVESGGALELAQVRAEGNRRWFRATIDPSRADGTLRTFAISIGDSFQRVMPFPPRTRNLSTQVVFPKPSIQLNSETGVVMLSSIDGAGGFFGAGSPSFGTPELCFATLFAADFQECVSAGNFSPAGWANQYNLPPIAFRIPRRWWTGFTIVGFRVRDSHSSYVATTTSYFFNALPTGSSHVANCSCLRFSNSCTLRIPVGTAYDLTPSWAMGPTIYRLEFPPPTGSTTPSVLQQYTTAGPSFLTGFLDVPLPRNNGFWGTSSFSYRVVTYEPAWQNDPEFFVSLSRASATDTTFSLVECQEIF